MNRRHFLKGLLGTGTLFYLEPSKFIFDMGANLYKPKPVIIQLLRTNDMSPEEKELAWKILGPQPITRKELPNGWSIDGYYLI